MSVKKKLFCLWIYYVFTLLYCVADENSFVPFGEIGRIPVSDATHFRLETKNDSYSMLSRTDWDDLRSFGMYYGFSSRKWALEITTDSLTNRTDSADTGSRIDQISFALTREIFRYDKAPVSVDISAGAGAIYLGNLGMLAIQELVHTIYKAMYEVPERYDNPQEPAIFTIDAIMRSVFDTGSVPISFFSTIEAGSTGFFRTGNYLEAEYTNGFLAAKFITGFQWIPDYRKSGNTFYETLHSESGLYAGAVFSAGIVETGFSYNLTTTRQAGYVALTFTDKKKQNPPSNGAESVDAIEFRLYPLLAGIRLQRSIIRFPVTISPLLGAESGPFMETNMIVPNDQHYRYEQIYFGLDVAYTVFSWLDVYLLGALGIRKDIWTTRTVIASQILDEKNSGIVFAESGVRLFLPTKNPRANEWGLGFSYEVLYVDAFETGIRDGIQLYLITTTNRRVR